MSKWANFNSKVNQEELRAKLDEARKNGEEVPKGNYTGIIEKIELKETKDGRPMFSVMFRIQEGNHKNKCLFLNRVMAGTKDDFAMQSGVETWLAKLHCPFDTQFNGNFDDFENMLLDVAEDIDGVQINIEYDPKAFNTIKILEVLE